MLITGLARRAGAEERMGPLSTAGTPQRLKRNALLVGVTIGVALYWSTLASVADAASSAGLPASSATTQVEGPSEPACDRSKVLREAIDATVDDGDSTTYPAAKRLLEQVIASGSPRARACATAKLAELLRKEKAENDAEAQGAAASSSWEQKLEKSWTAWEKKHLDPLKDLVPNVAGVIILLLVIARFLTGTLVRPDHEAPHDWARRAWWATGLALIALSGACIPLAFWVDSRPDGIWPVLFILATLALLTALMTPYGARRWRRPEAAVTVAGAVAAVLATPASDFAFVAPHLNVPEGGLPDVDLMMLTGAWAGAVGVVLMATARGLSLAIEVQVRGASGIDNSSHARMLVARLQELGSENPRDIRMIGPSDVTALPEDAMTAMPNGAWATALFNILKILRPAAPWRVTATQPDASTMVMDITRNRVPVERTALIIDVVDIPVAPANDKAAESSTDATKQEVALDELLTVAAAQTLLVVSGPHADLRVGLCGATDWRALAFHAIAGRTGVATERKRQLLHTAIDASPHYILPRMAVVNAMNDQHVAGRLRYARAISQLWDDFKLHLRPDIPSGSNPGPEATLELGPFPKLHAVESGYEAAQLRLLYNQAVAWMNVRADRASAKASDEEIRAAWEMSATAALGLDARLQFLRAHRVPAVESLRHDSRLPATYLLLDLNQCPPEGNKSKLQALVEDRARVLAPDGVLPEPQTRNDYYARACYYASTPESDRDSANNWRCALLDLEVAVTASRFAEWAPHDPSMAVFVENDGGERAEDSLIMRFKELIAPPPTPSYLDMPTFKPYAVALKAFGLTDLDGLLVVPRDDLAGAMKVHASVAARWIEVARLHHHLEALGNDEPVLMQLLELLLALGVRSPSDLRSRLVGDANGRAVFYRDMVKAAAAMRILPTWEQTIGLWVGDPKPRGVA
jgi:hypothetical protein